MHIFRLGKRVLEDNTLEMVQMLILLVLYTGLPFNSSPGVLVKVVVSKKNGGTTEAEIPGDSNLTDSQQLTIKD